MLLEDVLEEYFYYCTAKGFTKKTMINKRQELKQVKEFLIVNRGIQNLESVTTHDLKAYVRYKQQQGLKPQSINSMFKMVAAFFNWCVREEYLSKEITSKVDIPRLPKTVLKGFRMNEINKMIDAFSFKNYIEARNKCIIAMLSDCGLRAMELRTLKKSDIKETMILVNGKGNKERYVFISPVLKRIMIKHDRLKKEYFKNRTIKEDTYFLSYQCKGLSHVALDNIIKEAGRRANITDKRVSPHTFRHFYAVQCLMNGVDLHSLARLLGHSDISVTQRYLNSMTDTQLRDKAISASPLMNLGRSKND
ncbi:tyrosine-type recombinase/integrase [Bacillus sp. JJ722]|uniref:tyrosine-type recombinase/integrase n=1 Tax=Bacillus sp. JJ722 TaxID=3122973 RepID=UPI0030004B43